MPHTLSYQSYIATLIVVCRPIPTYMEHERSTSSDSAGFRDHIPASPANAQDEVRQILDTAAIGLTRCSRDLRYLACNRAYAKLAGLSADQIIGRAIVDVIGTEAFEVKRPYIERVLRGERIEYEEEVPFAAGGRRFLHLVYEPWFDSEGQVTGWIASVSDITDLKRTTKALRESEGRLRLAMSSGNIGFWDWDVIDGVVTWSPELYKIYGAEPGTVRTYQDFSSRVHPEDLAGLESECDAAVREILGMHT